MLQVHVKVCCREKMNEVVNKRWGGCGVTNCRFEMIDVSFCIFFDTQTTRIFSHLTYAMMQKDPCQAERVFDSSST